MVTFLRIGEPKRFVGSDTLLTMKDLSVRHVHQFHQVDIHLQDRYLNRRASVYTNRVVKFDADRHVGLPNQPKASRHPFPKTMTLSLNFSLSSNLWLLPRQSFSCAIQKRKTLQNHHCMRQAISIIRRV